MIEMFNRLKNEMPDILSHLAFLSTTYDDINRIQTFARENGLDSMENVINALKNAKVNLKWASKNVPVIMDTIKKIL